MSVFDEGIITEDIFIQNQFNKMKWSSDICNIAVKYWEKFNKIVNGSTEYSYILQVYNSLDKYIVEGAVYLNAHREKYQINKFEIKDSFDFYATVNTIDNLDGDDLIRIKIYGDLFK